MINYFKRYQVGFTFNKLFPSQQNICACGCGKALPPRRKKWFSNECRNESYIKFAIIKGDNSIIRAIVFDRDKGYCWSCGVNSETWEADHIISVTNGGGACYLENFQTLCKDCHKEKTYNFSHHKLISSQAASICLNRTFIAEGQYSKVF